MELINRQVVVDAIVSAYTERNKIPSMEQVIKAVIGARSYDTADLIKTLEHDMRDVKFRSKTKAQCIDEGFNYGIIHAKQTIERWGNSQ